MAKLTATIFAAMLLKLLSMAHMKSTGEDSGGMMAGMDKPEKGQYAKDTDGVISRDCSGAVAEYDASMAKGVQRLTYQEMYDLLKYNRTDFVLVDVRTPKEHADGHIPASFLVTITNGKFEDHIDFRQIMCGRKFLVFYCRSGRRALAAANLVKSQVPVKLYPGSWIEWSSMNKNNVVEHVKKSRA